MEKMMPSRYVQDDVVAAHYDEKYFAWQNADSDVSGSINIEKFRHFIPKAASSVVDFGCGGGSLLATLGVDHKIGIEINPVARAHAKSLGIEVYENIAMLQSQSVDCVISDHALEHTEQPLTELRQIWRVLRAGGRVIIVVPCDAVHYAFRQDDRDLHLYSWSAGNLGNLARAAGFRVLEVDELVHKWPPKWRSIHRLIGPYWFHKMCRLWALLDRSRSQVRLVGEKIAA